MKKKKSNDDKAMSTNFMKNKKVSFQKKTSISFSTKPPTASPTTKTSRPFEASDEAVATPRKEHLTHPQ